MQIQDYNRRLWIAIMVLTTGYSLCSTSVYPATLSIESGNAENGTQIVLNTLLTVSGSEAVSAIQYDVLYNPVVCEVISVTAGPSSISAQKQVQYNILSAGKVRIIIAGLNQNTIPGGSVAQITLQVCRSAPAGNYSLALSGVILSSPTGSSVPASAVNGSLQVQRTLYHSADQNQDWKISLTELLRVVQLYNSGGFYCSCGTEDGYGLTANSWDCYPHSSDYYGGSNWKIQL